MSSVQERKDVNTDSLKPLERARRVANSDLLSTHPCQSLFFHDSKKEFPRPVSWLYQDALVRTRVGDGCQLNPQKERTSRTKPRHRLPWQLSLLFRGLIQLTTLSCNDFSCIRNYTRRTKSMGKISPCDAAALSESNCLASDSLARLPWMQRH